MTSVASALNGAFMHIPTKTPRVHGLTTPTHARRRAEHPLAGGLRLTLGSGVGWRSDNSQFQLQLPAFSFWRGAGREPREENLGATLLHLIR